MSSTRVHVDQHERNDLPNSRISSTGRHALALAILRADASTRPLSLARDTPALRSFDERETPRRVRNTRSLCFFLDPPPPLESVPLIYSHGTQLFSSRSNGYRYRETLSLVESRKRDRAEQGYGFRRKCSVRVAASPLSAFATQARPPTNNDSASAARRSCTKVPLRVPPPSRRSSNELPVAAPDKLRAGTAGKGDRIAESGGLRRRCTSRWWKPAVEAAAAVVKRQVERAKERDGRSRWRVGSFGSEEENGRGETARGFKREREKVRTRSRSLSTRH